MHQNVSEKILKGIQGATEVDELETTRMVFQDSMGMTPNHASKLIQIMVEFISRGHCTRVRGVGLSPLWPLVHNIPTPTPAAGATLPTHS
jgi:hypothetical protein